MTDELEAFVRTAHGDAAVAALATHAGDRLPGLITHGAVRWVVVGRGALAEPRFFVDGAWCALDRHEAFAQALADSLPPLSPWQPIVRAWQSLTGEDVLVTEADVQDASDPGFHLFPLSAAARARWEPPTIIDDVLRFMSVRHDTVHVVRVDGRTLAVEVGRV